MFFNNSFWKSRWISPIRGNITKLPGLFMLIYKVNNVDVVQLPYWHVYSLKHRQKWSTFVKQNFQMHFVERNLFCLNLNSTDAFFFGLQMTRIQQWSTLIARFVGPTWGLSGDRWIPSRKGSVKRICWVFFNVTLDKLLNKQSNCRWFAMQWPSCYITLIDGMVALFSKKAGMKWMGLISFELIEA